MRILLVEDDDRIVQFMRRGFEGDDHSVDHASDSRTALDRLESARYDAAVLDVFLGDEDGLALCRELRRRSNDIPVLVMTAKDSSEMKSASVLAGADAYLAKPFSFEEMLSVLHQLTKPETSRDFSGGGTSRAFVTTGEHEALNFSQSDGLQGGAL